MAKRNTTKNSVRSGHVQAQSPPAHSSAGPRSDQSPPPRRGLRNEGVAISILLCALVITAYLPSLRNGFVNFDDRPFVFENSYVQNGLSWAGIGWAFQTLEGSFWHPLTWLSFMADRSLFGPEPWGHHLTNLVLHTASTVLLFLALQRMTRAAWPSAFVAALFGVHPLHVESVAWIAERKDVLSTFFLMLTIWTYVRYVEQSGTQGLGPKIKTGESEHPGQRPAPAIRKPPSPGIRSRATDQSLFYYTLALLFFLGGLMSKTMVVTLPLILLLLDWWPLRRFQQSPIKWQRAILLEKLPFLIASLFFGLLTIYSQHASGALTPATATTLSERAHTAACSYVRYLGQMFWPTDLAVFYPYPTTFPLWPAVLGAMLLLLLSIWVLRLWQQRPYLAVGWFWYLLTLLPVCGLIQMGDQAHADRYTYVPLIGVFLLITWSACDFARRWRFGITALAATAVIITGSCILATRHQVAYWNDSETLFRHALVVTRNNDVAQNNLGAALLGSGRLQEAIDHLGEAVRLAPTRVEARVNLGIALSRQGSFDEAAAQLQQALSLAPNNALAHCGLADVLTARGSLEAAIGHYREATRLNPEDRAAHHNLGVALNLKADTDGAIAEFREAIKLSPGFTEARSKLGAMLGKLGRLDEAIAELQESVRLSPTDPEARAALGDALVAKGRIDEAIAEYQQAVRLAPGDATAHHNLGVALGIIGHAAEAIGQLQETVRIKPDYAEARCDLGIALLREERLDEAISQLEKALALNAKLPEARHNLGVALGRKGRPAEAMRQFAEALKLGAGSAELHCDMGVALGKAGRWDEAVGQFQEALKLRPDYAEAQNDLQVALERTKAAPGTSPR